MSDRVKICLYQGKGIIGSLIKWQTRSRWSHASLLIDNDYVIEAREGRGVQRLSTPDLCCATVFEVRGLTEYQADKIVHLANSMVGAKYDWLAIFRFVTRRKMTSNDKWFCSELVYHLFSEAGVNLLHPSVSAWQVSPAILSYSPLLFGGTHHIPIDSAGGLSSQARVAYGC